MKEVIKIGRKCKCRICTNKLTTDVAYCVKVNGRNQYYCSEEEYNKEQEKKRDKIECNKYIAEIMRVPCITPAMMKLVNGLNDYYDYKIIKRAFKDNKDSIQWALANKEFNSEFAKCKYIISIILNNIEKSKKAWIKEQEELQKLFNKTNSNNVDIEILNFNRIDVKTKQNSDISMFLED